VWFLIATYLVLVFVLPATVTALVSYRALSRGRDCPACGGDTLLLMAPALRRFAEVVPWAGLERRWCLCCGWEGTVRTGDPDRDTRWYAGRIARALPSERDAGNAGPRGAPVGGGTQTLDVRSLTMDGTAWRVMLQCRHGEGGCYGRFVFVSPSGRLWLDPMDSLSAPTEDDLVGQARSLPDRLLARRLRRLVASY
jgi:hypothetical protein